MLKSDKVGQGQVQGQDPRLGASQQESSRDPDSALVRESLCQSPAGSSFTRPKESSHKTAGRAFGGVRLGAGIREGPRTLWESSLLATEQRHQCLGERETPCWFLGILILARTEAGAMKHRGIREPRCGADRKGV